MAAARLAIPADKECACCFEALSPDNVCEYRPARGVWRLSNYCCSCVQYLVDNQFANYKKAVEGSTCKRELTAYITAGPPIFVSDKHGLPLEEGEEHADFLYYGTDKQERSARLTGAVEGEEHRKLWDFYREFSSSRLNQPDDED
jgi:hypothetical protein